MSTSILRLVWIYPDLLSTYGDRGNLLVLSHRAEARQIMTESIMVRSDQVVPREADIYLIGGGEDGPQSLAAQKLIADGAVTDAAARDKVVFSVCAGYQIMGRSFIAGDRQHAGLGLLDITSDRGPTRAVGELAGDVHPQLGLPTLTGFENHGGRTHIGQESAPLVPQVSHGIGNDETSEGAWRGKVIGTYLHGPALARNPQLADLLLSWAVGRPVDQLGQLDDTWSQQLRQERLAALA
ncbi:hypothetical protein FB566_4992 [Stackebrandtia endophytica]|uniref:Lipid II isoglutaminyl synthase (glutamine-hydrolyzing) subunit GatD n=1 Tax=Stackebrandtia endophytica TaxID=1496996 RepID=A0A543B3Q0_9ACTN|nr:glutamine amidotransferase [Stackebrandtia endophytica]TQL79390.1 hypothetical protein FB566_4992 [Stackebrandtia endophytica]